MAATADPGPGPGAPPRPAPFCSSAAGGRWPRPRGGWRSPIPSDGWVEHDAESASSQIRVAVMREALKAVRRGPWARWRRSGSPTSARPWWSGSGGRAGRSIRRSSGRTAARPTACARPLRGQGLEADKVAEATGLLLDPYFCRPPRSRLDPRRMWTARTGRGRKARRTAGRDHRRMADLEADRRTGARHGRHQRLAHPLDGPGAPGLVAEDLCELFKRPHRPPAGDPRLRGRLSATVSARAPGRAPCPSAARPATSRRR